MLFRDLEGIVLATHPNEYFCHIQFVVHLASHLSLSNQDVDFEVIRIAALLHDIGRHQEFPGESHEQAGARIATKLLKKKISDSKMKLVVSCILNHNHPQKCQTAEEQIVACADSLSKVIFHESFMLLCKKRSPIGRAKWGLKHLTKGFTNISFDKERRKVAQKYDQIRLMYESIIDSSSYD